jgi:hypothetical protein
MSKPSYKNYFTLLLQISAGLLLTGSVYAQVNHTPDQQPGYGSAASPLMIAQQTDNSASQPAAGNDKSSDEMANTAREAYQDEDGKPVESWFGCPPAKVEGESGGEEITTVAANTKDGDVDKSEPANEDCDPDAPQNDSPQKD